MVSGLVRSGSNWGHIATLPTNCRPNHQLIFNLNNHWGTSRVDVQTNGEVHWRAGGRSHGWLSLTGITFATGSPAHQVVPYSGGWRDYGGSWVGARATVTGGSCLVS